MNPIQVNFLDAILALDGLNSYVRSKSYVNNGIHCKFAVYHMKLQALRYMHEQGRVLMRGIKVKAKCKRCTGGKWESMDGYYSGDNCRYCDGKGNAVLKFVEFRCDIGFDVLVWHVPEVVSRGGIATSITYYLGGYEGEKWSPNQPGKDLLPTDVIEFLNIAEEVFTKPAENRYGDDCQYASNDMVYTMELGTKPNCCERCKQDQDLLILQHLRNGFFEWTACLCKKCEQQTEGSFNHEFPYHLVTEPIRKWHRRHVDYYNTIVYPNNRWTSQSGVMPHFSEP